MILIWIPARTLGPPKGQRAFKLEFLTESVDPQQVSKRVPGRIIGFAIDIKRNPLQNLVFSHGYHQEFLAEPLGFHNMSSRELPGRTLGCRTDSKRTARRNLGILQLLKTNSLKDPSVSKLIAKGFLAEPLICQMISRGSPQTVLELLAGFSRNSWQNPWN